MRPWLPRLFLILILGLFVWDTQVWAWVAQWREDQAVDLWLALTQPVNALPVTHRSSISLPMPNGVALLAKPFLWIFPSVSSLCVALGLMQLAALAWLGWKSSRGASPLYAAALIALLCTQPVLRTTGVQWIGPWSIVITQCLLLAWALNYYTRPSWRALPALCLLGTLPSAIFLGGLLNSVVTAVLALGLVVLKPPGRPRLRADYLSIGASILLIAAQVIWTWIPYFKAIAIEGGIRSYGNLPLTARLWQGYLEVLKLPLALSEFWTPTLFVHGWYGTPGIIGAIRGFFEVPLLFNFLTAVGLAGGAAFWLFADTSTRDLERPTLRAFAFAFFALLVSYAFSPLLGGLSISSLGPERIYYKYPLMPWVIVLTASGVSLAIALIRAERFRRIIRIAALCGAFGISLWGFYTGHHVARAHLDYRGPALSDADVPWLHKAQAVEFIASHYRAQKDPKVEIEHDTVGIWDWVVPNSVNLNPFYGKALFTIGRALDFELKHRYGISNAMESVWFRELGKAEWVISYVFKPAPARPGKSVTHREFGRLRVSRFGSQALGG